MDVSEHLLRECLYCLNAELLKSRSTPASLARAIVDIFDREGPRFHEPTLMVDWAAAVALEPDELVFELEQALEMVMEELEDDEEPWSAHRLLDLVSEEPFWVLSWSLPGDGLPAPARPVRGVPVPLPLRPRLVAILDQLEVTLFDAKQDQRSVYDPVPKRVVQAALDRAMAAIEGLSRKSATPSDPLGALIHPEHALPSLRTALQRIQRWKLSVHFDASPDEDDGEWTLRVLERLYELEWVVPEPRT